ncbi:choice-of-anchor Q domain-containing protein [Dyadobacter sp. 32]|uniref:choice-of-anchor Q domain-containing protein n=1 Tax=Dyadobacter sp. 32 TaxID=538966 RepID=UPI0011F03A42
MIVRSITVLLPQLLQNQAQSGGAACSNISAKPRFVNVTIVGNSASENGGALHNYQGAETELVNTIVWSNTQLPASSLLYTVGSGKTTAYFSILQGGAAAILGEKTAADVLGQDPRFTDHLNADFSLQACSPAINIGTGNVLTGLPADLAGNARIVGIADAGAYEFQSARLTGADRLATNGDVTTVQITTGQNYLIQVAGDVCRSVAGIGSKGSSSLSGSVNITTWVDNAVQTHNGTPYVPRHYDISPATGAATATARVTLYFTQGEFTLYNKALVSNGLPTAPDDLTGRASLRVYQHHGPPKEGQNGPGAYTGGMSTIVPDLSWNIAMERWEVSFDVTGFSGFFIGSASSPLPVKLVRFSGKQTDSKSVQLQWQVVEQVDIEQYVVEFSADAKNFVAIGQVGANHLQQTIYQFEDVQARNVQTAY